LTNPTIGVSFLSKRIDKNGKKLKYLIWDTAGAERFRSIAPNYFRGSIAAIFVYDITSQTSFRKMKDWMSELENNVDDEIIKIIVGNKKTKKLFVLLVWMRQDLMRIETIVHIMRHLPKQRKEYLQCLTI